MQKKEYTPQQLANLLGSADPAGLPVLYDAYSGALYNVLLTMLGNEITAQKALCDAFVAIHKESHSYNPAVSSPFTWMLRKAVATGLAYAENKDTATLRLKKAFIEERWKG